MFRIDRWFPVWIYFPCWNLGCLGFKLGFGMMGLIYFDLAVSPTFGGIYLRVINTRYRSNFFRPWKWWRVR